MKETAGKAVLWVAVLLVVPALIWAAGWLSSGRPGVLGIGKWRPSDAYLATLVLMALFCFVTGKAVTGLWRGLLIDERNRISLSRLQTATWTVVVLSAILVAAFSNLAHQDRAFKESARRKAAPPSNKDLRLPEGGPLDFPIPPELWVVLGISVTSLIGSPLLLDPKKNKPANVTEAAKVTRTLETQGETTVTNQGQILVRNSPADAKWEDLFQTDEVGNGAHLDLAKVQNFYFTLILVFAYSNALFTMFSSAPPVQQFPELSAGMVSLLAISHAAYLTNKARTHSQTGTAGDGEVNPTEAGAKLRALRLSTTTSPAAPASPGTGGTTTLTPPASHTPP